MKRIQYLINNPHNVGTKERPVLEDKLFPKSIPYSEANEEIAKKEAYNGEYAVEDDGVEEVVKPTQEERIAELEEALALLLTGATE